MTEPPDTGGHGGGERPGPPTVRRHSRHRGAAALATWGLFAVVTALGVVASADPAAAQACNNESGVTVVVDFAGLGGGVVTACAGDGPADGFAALSSAGFSVTRVTNMAGFICRIDGRPSPETETCVDTPPATAFWAYWVANRGGAWQTSNRGAGDRTPPPGGVEGWVFSAGGASTPPSVAPPPPPPTPTTTTTTTTTTAPTTTTVPPATTPTTTTTTTTTATTPTTTTTPATVTPTTTTTTTTSTTPTTTTATTSVPFGEPDAAVDAPDDDDSPGTTAAGVALVVVVGTTATLVARRRRGGAG